MSKFFINRPIFASVISIVIVLAGLVAAMVLPDEALSHNLLGMSFLSKVKWEHRNGRLILEQ